MLLLGLLSLRLSLGLRLLLLLLLLLMMRLLLLLLRPTGGPPIAGELVPAASAASTSSAARLTGSHFVHRPKERIHCMCSSSSLGSDVDCLPRITPLLFDGCFHVIR